MLYLLGEGVCGLLWAAVLVRGIELSQSEGRFTCDEVL
jgi:hypothetical protein